MRTDRLILTLKQANLSCYTFQSHRLSLISSRLVNTDMDILTRRAGDGHTARRKRTGDIISLCGMKLAGWPRPADSHRSRCLNSTLPQESSTLVRRSIGQTTLSARMEPSKLFTSRPRHRSFLKLISRSSLTTLLLLMPV